MSRQRPTGKQALLFRECPSRAGEPIESKRVRLLRKHGVQPVEMCADSHESVRDVWFVWSGTQVDW